MAICGEAGLNPRPISRGNIIPELSGSNCERKGSPDASTGAEESPRAEVRHTEQFCPGVCVRVRVHARVCFNALAFEPQNIAWFYKIVSVLRADHIKVSKHVLMTSS